MRLQHLKTIQPAGKLKDNGRFPRITSICWSSNNLKFAISNSNRNIIIYDSDGNERDKFATKSANKEDTTKKYQISSIQFSPDSTKLAIAQTDNIVYIYRLGDDATKFGEKKSICNKFAVSSPVTCMCWPNKRNDELVFGLANGKLKIGILKINGVRKNKSATLYETNSYVNHVVSNQNGTYFYSVHANKCIYQYTFPENGGSAKKILFTQLSFIPNTIQIGGMERKDGDNNNNYNEVDEVKEDVVVTSINGIVQILNGNNGEMKQHLEYNEQRLIHCAAMNPSGQNVVFGGFDCFFVASYNRKSKQWEKGYTYNIDNIGTITSIMWKFDGSKLSIGTMVGSIDFYDACLKKYKYSDRFSIVYTALNSVVVHNRFSDDKISIKTNLGGEIQKIQIIQNQFVVAKTEQSLILADMSQTKSIEDGGDSSELLTEIEWHNAATMNSDDEKSEDKRMREKYNFDTPGIAMIFYSSELFIVELGCNEILGSCRTEFNSAHLVSLRIINDGHKRKKIIAYLLDLLSICIMDLDNNIEIETINHDLKIEWLELNEFGNELLFMDKKRSLHLYHVEDEDNNNGPSQRGNFAASNTSNTNKQQKRITLLNFCNYAQWVPESNVIVAQNRNRLCVWYNIHNTGQVTIVDIKGDVEDIQRSDDKTLVLVNEGQSIIQYTLNESLITFGTALDNKQYESAVTKLERLCDKMDISQNSEIQSMWKQLSQIALKNNDYKIAQRCFIALGDICKAQYLNDIIQNDSTNTNTNGNNKNYERDAKLAILNKHFKKAESIYIANGEIDKAIVLYINLNKWEDAIKLCKLRKHPLLNQIKQKYFDYLLQSQQQNKAARLKEIDGDYLGAVHLYLSNGFASTALKLIIKHKIPMDGNHEMVDEMYHILTSKQNDYENAGSLFEYLSDQRRAFNIYMEGHCYWKAIDLAKKYNSQFGDKVIEIEGKWGQYLYDKGEYNSALHHFIESGQYINAIQCAIKCKQFSKAIEILQGLNDKTEEILSFYQQIAEHYKQANKYRIAEKLYIKGGYIKEAVIMQLNAGNFERSNELAMHYLPDININDLYFEEASRLEIQGKVEEAASILVKANDIDNAILLLKKNGKFNKIIEIISKYKPSELNSAYSLIATQMKNEGDLKNAETYFVKANEWKSAVAMYEDNHMIDDALNVCKKYGGILAFKNMVFEYCLSFGDDNKAIEMLMGYNLYDKCCDYLLNRGMFLKAFEIADEFCKDKLDAIHYQYALNLEENGQYEKAEEEFVQCNKAKEAIEMYIHQKKWEDAIRVAQIHEPNVIEQVYKAHGIVSMEENNLNEAEKWYIEANAVQDAIKMYEDRGMYNDALRLAQQHIPSLVHQLRLKQMNQSQNNNVMNQAGNMNMNNGNSSELQSIVSRANFYKENGNYEEAVDVLLTIQYPQHSQNLNEIMSIWEEAVNISMEKALVNLPNTIGYIAKQLLDLGEYERSAQYYLEINDHKSAINSFLSGNMFDKAKEVCNIYSIADSDAIINEINQRYEQFLLSNDQDLSKLESMNPSLATKIYGDKNKWDMAYKIAKMHGKSAVANSALQHSQSLFKDGEYIEAVTVLYEKGLQKSTETLTFYSDLMNMLLVQINNSDAILINKSDALSIFEKCNKILHSIVSWLDKENNENLNNFMELLQLFHLLYIKYKCWQNENDSLSILYNKQCLSLLSYCDWIRCDVLFENTGDSYKKIKKYQHAFIYYNHFVDICDNIDDPNDEIDYSDFENCSNISIPHKNIPNKHIFSEKHREEIRDWVLEMLATSEINPALSNQNGNGNLMGKCIITGTELYESDNIVKCRSCSQIADKSSWNIYVDYFKTCPWCKQTQAPIY